MNRSDGRPGLWAYFDDETDDGIDPHCVNCGEPFPGMPKDKYCPRCRSIVAHVGEYSREVEENAVDASDAFEEGEL